MWREFKKTWRSLYCTLNAIGFNRILWRGGWQRFPFVAHSHTWLGIQEGAKLQILGKLIVGYQLFEGARQETRLLLMRNSCLEVSGKYTIRAGCTIRLEPGSHLILHDGFMNENVQIFCGDTIEIGEGTVIGNDTVIRSDDGHKILEEDYCQSKPIVIGKHVWIGQGVRILKGVRIGDGAIIASGAIVTKDIPAKTMAAGIPAKVIKTNVKWAK